MPVAIIKKIMRILFGSLDPFYIFIMNFILSMPFLIRDLNEWIHNEDDVEKKVPTNLPYGSFNNFIHRVNYVIICCIILYYLGSFCCILIVLLLHYLNNLYNRFFCRNQDNEQAVHFQDDRIHWNGQAIVYPQNLAREDEL
ncbi:uncharacterized protein LOC109609808 isoform X2 [Camponotus floridanus]|uniref:uncharacterized protein LOC109609808 isoform X2 n=1 Tax=Camponotus floridanus TaxID=104421 RepID=UPI000DC69B0B|nr:uncharacterized protein LOC109609808 isoform X2 [Camponotus floridanus]